MLTQEVMFLLQLQTLTMNSMKASQMHHGQMELKYATLSIQQPIAKRFKTKRSTSP